MQTFKSAAVSTLAAAATLALVALSAPAQAGWGYSQSTTKLNGLSLNGIQLQGTHLNGHRVHGIDDGGCTDAGRPVGITLAGGRHFHLR